LGRGRIKEVRDKTGGGERMTGIETAAGAAAGGVLGYLWHRLVGCSTGGCPIVRNPYLSVVWGALLGATFSLGR